MKTQHSHGKARCEENGLLDGTRTKRALCSEINSGQELEGQLRSDDLFGSSPQGVGRKIKVIPRYSRSFGEARIFHLGGKNCSTEGGIVRSNEGKNFSTWNKAKIVPRLNVPLFMVSSYPNFHCSSGSRAWSK